jgi:hypothetical protein
MQGVRDFCPVFASFVRDTNRSCHITATLIKVAQARPIRRKKSRVLREKKSFLGNIERFAVFGQPVVHLNWLSRWGLYIFVDIFKYFL